MSEVVKVDCPECGVRLKVKPKLLGTQQKCPGCGGQITLEPTTKGDSVEIASSASIPANVDKGTSVSIGKLAIAGIVLVSVGLGVGWLIFGQNDAQPELNRVAENGESESVETSITQPASDELSQGSESAPRQPDRSLTSAASSLPEQSIFPTEETPVANTTSVLASSAVAAPTASSAGASPTSGEPEANEIVQPRSVTPASVAQNVAAVARPGEPNSIGMILHFIEAGYYERKCGYNRPNYHAAFSSHASYGGFSDENPAHDVVITRPFLIGQTEVTVGQFRQFVEATSYQTTAETNGKGIIGLHGEIQPDQRIYNPLGQRSEFTWKNPGFEQNDNHPVTGVSWDDTQAFCRWLSEKEGAAYRLPSEAEWEYACRAGSRTWFSFGDDYTDRIHEYANIADRTLEETHERVAALQWVLPDTHDGAVYTSEVKRYQPNAWGLYDMHGNVWEWCQDVYHDVFYKQFRATREDAWNCAVDPLNLDQHTWEPGEFHSIRGGSWVVAPIQSRTGTRSPFERADAACYLGFRVVREAPANVLAEADAYRQRQVQAEATVKTFEHHQLTFENAPDDEGADLTLYTHREPPPPEFIAAIPYMTRVRYLRPHGELSPALLQSASKLTKLRRLVFSYPRETCPANEFDVLADLEQLVDFQAEGSSITPAQLRNFKCLPNLRQLAFGNESIDDAQILTLRGIDFGNLKWLNVRSTLSDGSGLAAFTGAPLETLYLKSLTDQGAIEVAKFPELASLTLSEPKITRAGLAELTKLKHLRRLYLSNLDQLEDADFSQLGSMTGLRDLRLNGSGAGDQTAEIISSLLLTNLQIGSPAFTDEGIRHIGNITTLTGELFIGADSQVTDHGLTYLWGPSRLRTLKLAQLSGITGVGFETVSDLTELRQIEIFSEDFTDTGMRFLGYLPNLNTVTIGHYRGGPKGVTDEGLMMLAEAPSLKRFTFNPNGSQVTEAGLQRLRERLPDLELQVRE